jgi:hypothetical protein
VEKIKNRTGSWKTSPPSEYDLDHTTLATALALAGILAFATGITGLATALAFTRILAFAVMLSGVGIISQLAFGNGAGLIGTATGRGGMDTSCRTSHQPGEGDGGEHGFSGLEETWIFHLSYNPFLFPIGVVVDPL